MKFERKDNFRIEVTDGKGRESMDSQSVECCLLYAILEKLEEIRCWIVDVETAIEDNFTGLSPFLHTPYCRITHLKLVAGAIAPNRK